MSKIIDLAYPNFPSSEISTINFSNIRCFQQLNYLYEFAKKLWPKPTQEIYLNHIHVGIQNEQIHVIDGLIHLSSLLITT